MSSWNAREAAIITSAHKISAPTSVHPVYPPMPRYSENGKFCHFEKIKKPKNKCHFSKN